MAHWRGGKIVFGRRHVNCFDVAIMDVGAYVAEYDSTGICPSTLPTFDLITDCYGDYGEGDLYDRNDPVLSPDGTLVAYSEVGLSADIVLHRLSDDTVTNLTENWKDYMDVNLSSEVTPCWSPDGQRLLFSSARGANFNTTFVMELWMMEIDDPASAFKVDISGDNTYGNKTRPDWINVE